MLLLDLQFSLRSFLLPASGFRGLRAATRAFRSPWTFGYMLLLDLHFI
ncbi:MAG: hypothetical protein IKH38_06530 [Clostridia bacterium]|nr:hypothetical protein [Clostridia bacterium]